MTTRLFNVSWSADRAVRAMLVASIIGLSGIIACAGPADARLGGGSSFGSRGSRTFSMPSATPTAPRVSPFQRSTTPSSGFSNPGYGSAVGGARSGGFFGGGFGRGLLGGLVGAGLLGMLFGNGLTGGLGGGLSFIGLILQLGLLYLAFRFIMGFFANRRQTSAAGGTSSYFGQSPSQGGMANGFGGTPKPNVRSGAPINIGPQDYEAFENRLAQSQAAYSNGDLGTLRRIATQEMVGNFEQELRNNERQNVVNRLSDVRLLNGDLAEAWNEGGSDYATVAMRFSLLDAMIDKASGRVVAGDTTHPQEVTEVWTFRRPAGGGPQAWALSGIQQA